MASDALLELVRGLCAEDVLEECGRAQALAGGPREPLVELVELVERASQSEEVEVASESCEDGVVVGSATVSRLGRGVWLRWAMGADHLSSVHIRRQDGSGRGLTMVLASARLASEVIIGGPAERVMAHRTGCAITSVTI